MHWVEQRTASQRRILRWPTGSPATAEPDAPRNTRARGCLDAAPGPLEKFRAMPATNSKSVSLSRFANRASGSHAGKQAAGLLDATGVRRCGPVLRALPKQ